MAGKYGRTTIEKLREDTIDISERKKFKFYNLCWYWDTQNNNTESRIGRWLGDSNRVGSALSYWFLSEKWNIISHTNVQHATQDEAENLEIQQSILELPYGTGVCHWYIWIYVGYRWHGCIYQWGVSITRKRRCLGGTRQ